jgi:hypothetical protein
MSCKRLLLLVSILLSILLPRAAYADIECDATLTIVDGGGEPQSVSLRAYVKSNRVRLEYVDSGTAIILRSDLQTLITIQPEESAYWERGFNQLYVTPFGSKSLLIPPGFVEPVVEFIATGESQIIHGVSCKKYVIQEIASFRLLQYTIYATEELAFPESFASFFFTDSPLSYRPFEEMKKIPGLPLKVEIVENVDGNSFTSIYEFSNYQASALDEAIFAVPAGYTPN